MDQGPKPFLPDPEDTADAGRYFRYMSEFVGFTAEDREAIRQTGLIVEKHLPAIIGRFYTNLLQYPPTRRFFLKKDGSVDNDYLQLRMYHQANFWRRTAAAAYDDNYAHFVDYVGRAHTSRGADKRIYIAERYVIGMVGFVQHAIIDAIMNELHPYDTELERRAVKAWNKLCMVVLEMLARAYGHEHETEGQQALVAVDPDSITAMSVEAYEIGLGLNKKPEFTEVVVADVSEIPNGERKIVEVDGVSIGIFHHKGNWYALRNSCLHRGGPVCTGRMIDDAIVCPWHGYTYNVTNGELLIDHTAKLEMYPVIIDGDVIRLRIREMIENAGMLMQETPVSPDAPITRLESDQAAVVQAETLKENEFHTAELLPGQVKLVNVESIPVAVYNVDGEYYATDDECTHAGGPLSEGDLKGKLIYCPWHHSCFDVTSGAATCPPATDPVATFRVVIENGIGSVLKP